jgi:hypothetical protein
MTTATKNLVAWNGEAYKGASDYYEQFTTDPEFLEFTSDLDADELLRLAMFAHNGSWQLVPEDLPALIAQEQEAFWGEFDSGAEFAEHVATELGEMTPPDWVFIDWQASYDNGLRHDFFDYRVIDQEGNYRMFFWNANV